MHEHIVLIEYFFDVELRAYDNFKDFQSVSSVVNITLT